MPRRSSSSSPKEIEKSVRSILQNWLETQSQGKRIPVGLSNGALHLFEVLRKGFPLKRSDFTSRGGSQVKGLSGASGDRIIRRFFSAAPSIGTEAGRTSRGTLPAVEILAREINGVSGISEFTEVQRGRLADGLQKWVVDNAIRKYFGQKKLEPPIDISLSAVANIAAVLSTAADRSQAGPVAQHLVGAKLALRYPELEIENHSYSTADAPLKRQGDFVVGDTAFHVTVTPTPALLEKCEWNLRQGYRPVVLIPDRKREGTLQVAESMGLKERVEVLAIEAFVGQNIEELSGFGQAAFGENMRRLLEVYNQRVEGSETDPSLLIEIPDNLGTF